MAPQPNLGYLAAERLHPQSESGSHGGGGAGLQSGSVTGRDSVGTAGSSFVGNVAVHHESTNPSGLSPLPATPPAIEQFVGLRHQDLVARFARGVECFDRRLLQLTSQQADTAFLPEAGVGRWPARVLVGHLADAELVFTHRMRRAVAEDNPLLAIFDEQAFIDSGLYGVVASDPGKPIVVPAHSPPIPGFVAVIHTIRRWTSDWLGSLSPKQWERGCLHPERGPQTVRKIAEYDTWHLEHHAWYLNRKIARLLGENPDPANA